MRAITTKLRISFRFAAVAVVLAVLGASAPSTAGNAPSGLTQSFPAAFRDAAVHPRLFKSVTRYEVSDAEYRSLGAADRGRIFVENGYKISSAWDRRKRLVVAERSCCSLQEWIIFAAPVPPTGAATVDLGAVTVGGIGIGDPVSRVERRFGRSDSEVDAGDQRLRYRHQRTHDCATYYTFDVHHGRVRAISVKNAC
jgi:hypothetical protein